SRPVGRAIATERVVDVKDIPDYEFPDSGHVKVKMTRSEIAMLDSLPSELDMSHSSTVLPENSKQSDADIVKIRLITTTAVLLTCGLFGVIMNISAQGADNKGWRKYTIGYAALALAFFMRDWFRLHGQKLSRHLKPLINISQLVANWNFFPWFEVFAPGKETVAGKYLFNAEGPVLNEDIPRTPDKSPPKSPPKTADVASVGNPKTQKGM
uniref:Uncharacterized protein n=1 Tax=Parascaris univalens TaxID=6257 RepID=A0A914ZM22_PARUN